METVGFEAKLLGSGDASSLRLKVGGMTCATCSSAIEKALCDTPGVALASVSLITSSAEVLCARHTSTGSTCCARTIEGLFVHGRWNTIRRWWVPATSSAGSASWAMRPAQWRRMTFPRVHPLHPARKPAVLPGIEQALLPVSWHLSTLQQPARPSDPASKPAVCAGARHGRAREGEAVLVAQGPVLPGVQRARLPAGHGVWQHRGPRPAWPEHRRWRLYR